MYVCASINNALPNYVARNIISACAFYCSASHFFAPLVVNNSKLLPMKGRILFLMAVRLLLLTVVVYCYILHLHQRNVLGNKKCFAGLLCCKSSYLNLATLFCIN